MASTLTGMLPKWLNPFQSDTIIVNNKQKIDTPQKSIQVAGDKPMSASRAAIAGGGDKGLSLDPLGRRGRGTSGQTTLLGR